jgi:trehalose synthase
MSALLDSYAHVTGEDVIDHLRQLSAPLQGLRMVHVNSTRIGGGVAEILAKLIPLMSELGIDASWEIIEGNDDFFQCTKAFHNALQGHPVAIPDSLLRVYEEINAQNMERLRPVLREADIVVIHDPQPAPLLNLVPERSGKWIWRCHIDISRPYRQVWKYLRNFVAGYDASIFSLAAFAQDMPHTKYLLPPSIDPLSEKNMDLEPSELSALHERFELDPDRWIALQVSRFDRFKDPLGVIQAYRLAKTFSPSLQLVLAGGSATDDPEGEAVLDEVRKAADADPDVHILLLPPDAHRTINGLQRIADIVLQKSTREGFGLTVTEAMWKCKPVIGGDTGGIRLQVVNHHTGFLVSTPEGAALRMRYFINYRDRLHEMGQKAREFVRENFLITRHIREYLTLTIALLHNAKERIELN